MAKTAPWTPESTLPLSNGSLTLFVKRGAKSGFKSGNRAPEVRPQSKGASMTASAVRVTGNTQVRAVRRSTGAASLGWQDEVLAAYVQIGELRYIANTTANAASRAWVFPANARDAADETNRNRPYASVTDNAPEEDGAPPGAIDPEIVRRCALLLVLIGECYVVELPRSAGRPSADYTPEVHILAPQDISIMENEVRLWGETTGAGTVTGGKVYPLRGSGAAKVTRIHRPDVRNADLPDSAARSALPVMREILELGMHVSATVQSRVKTAGVVEYPMSAQGIDRDGNQVDFAESMTEAMNIPVSNPGEAGALTPIMVGVPEPVGGGSDARIHWHLPPGSTLDTQVHTLRDDNIRRLALGMDAPPEVILGAKGLSHFGAWSVEGEFIRLQIAPLLKLICDGLTIAFGEIYTFDTGPLTVRPNKAVEAQALYDRGVLSDESLRAACGFSEDDKPQEGDRDQQAHDLAVAMVRNSPSLLQTPGFPAVVDQFRISFGLPAKFQEYYPGQPNAPLAGSPDKNDEPSGATNGRDEPRNGGDGEQPESNRPVSDGSPETGADGEPHDVPGTD